MAEIILNGKPAGTLWKEPFRINLTNYLVAGTNELECRVANLWTNRCIGDAWLPEENEYKENHYLNRLPAWFIQNQPKPGERITFLTWNGFSRSDQLVASGLLGSVRLLIGIEKRI
jgi:hypothetical protein